MRKLLGILGSPRKNGNTHILISKMLEGANEGGFETDLILLTDLKIKECDGCHACWKGNPCSKNDDMNDLYPRIIESDVLIFGTPVYWYGPTALIKGFLDRFVFFNNEENRQKIKGKDVVLVVPFEEDNLATADPLVSMFKKSFEYLELNLKHILLIPGVYEKGDVLNKTEKLNEAHEIGKNLFK